MIIAIDGPAGAGKGTLARALAAELGFAYLDTGLLYRAVAREVLDRAIDPTDAAACASVAEALVLATLERDGLRSEEVGQAASKVSAIPGVRAALFDFQRRFGMAPPGGAAGAVLDGRDIGTVVFPEADVKFWLTADIDARARPLPPSAGTSGPDTGR